MCALALYGVFVGTTVELVVEVDVGIAVDLGVGDAPVAVGVGLGVRKSYVSVPTRCKGSTPGVNVGRIT